MGDGVNEWGEVLDLLVAAPGPPEGEDTLPIAAEALERLRVASGLPTLLVEWLSLVNGARKGPGGLCGIRPDTPDLDIHAIRSWFPDWDGLGCIPVAGDGNGNFYVLTPRVGEWVSFIDGEVDPAVPDHVVASDLRVFLRELLRKEIRGGRWPFDPDYTLAVDPDIALAPPFPLAWR